jgi:hypothetical protein
MKQLFSYFTEEQKGSILIISGAILLLHTLGLVRKGLDLIIIAGALYAIVLGFQKTQYHMKILALIKRDNQPKE